MNIKKLKGFTLLELIIVIAIISVMLMVLVPVVGDRIKMSKMNAANDQAREIYLAAQDCLVDLQLRGSKPLADDTVYLTMANTNGVWAASWDPKISTGGNWNSAYDQTARDEVADALVNAVVDRMGGDFKGNKRAACIIAFYPQTFTIKHVVYCNYTSNAEQQNVAWAQGIGGGGTGGGHENLYVSRFGATGHTQEHDYLNPNADGSHPYVGQFPIS